MLEEKGGIMAANVIGDNINDIFIKSLYHVRDRGTLLNIRGSEVKEVLNFTYELTNINNNILTIPFRYNNFPAVCFETLWVLSGCNHLDDLKYFLPNCVDYSDDGGGTWGGAYGPRIRFGGNQNFRWHNINEPMKYVLKDDQIFHVIKTLIDDNFSRQAIITIGMANDYSTNLETNDRPCNMALQFYIRDERLHCTVTQRSGDCIWGVFNINIFEWTTLQRLIADCLGVRTGSLTHNITSFHYYTKQHEAMVEKILKSKNMIPLIYNGEYDVSYDDSRLDKSLENIEIYKKLDCHYDNIAFSYHILSKTIHNKELDDSSVRNSFIPQPNYQIIKRLFTCARLFTLLKQKKYNKIIELFEEIDLDIYYIAMLEYAIRYCWKNNKDDILPIAPILDNDKTKSLPFNIDKFVHWGIHNENKKDL